MISHQPKDQRVRAEASLKDVAVISFDLDDTFWDCEPAIRRAEQHLYKWLQSATPRITAAHDPQSLLVFREAFRALNPQLAGCVTAMRVSGLKALLTEFDYDETMADEAFADFIKVRSEVKLYSGVPELLEALSKRYRLAAITNGNADLAAIGIDGFFDQVLAADLELKAKPSADMFDRCCAFFETDSANILHIGDNQVTDVRGAIDAGMQSLWFNQHQLPWTESLPPPHFEAHSIEQVKSMLTTA